MDIKLGTAKSTLGLVKSIWHKGWDQWITASVWVNKVMLRGPKPKIREARDREDTITLVSNY